ncbi:MAG: hypothetical protein G01um101444_67 [Parcubacteria group bacterium Gr01-1014_44]|nr:MAG: hypothetical protein G01um101444_67 [Parcubacteria group bacterium Gr01-1014_44]
MRPKIIETDSRVYSKPTMCLDCHLVVNMSHEQNTDPVKGAWQCPKCGHQYKFAHWKIKNRKGKNEPTPEPETENKKGATFLPNWSDALSQSQNYKRK